MKVPAPERERKRFKQLEFIFNSSDSDELVGGKYQLSEQNRGEMIQTC